MRYLTNLGFVDLFGEFQPTILFFALCLVWIKLSPLVDNALQSANWSKKMSHFIFREEVFYSILRAQNQVKPLDGIPSMHLVKGSSDFVITIVTNLECKPCANLHYRIEELLKRSFDKLNIRFVLITRDRPGELINKVAMQLVGIYLQKGFCVCFGRFTQLVCKGLDCR